MQYARADILKAILETEQKDTQAAIDGASDALANMLTEISAQAESNAVEMVAEGQRLQMASMLVVIAVIGFSIVLAVVLGLCISNEIRRPVEEIKAAAGSMGVSLDYQSRDELGNLFDSMRSLIHTFRGIIDDMSYGLANCGSGQEGDIRKRENAGLQANTFIFTNRGGGDSLWNLKRMLRKIFCH